MIHLITGGSASGKSSYAEKIAVELQKGYGESMIYLATMHVDSTSETRGRILRHREMRREKEFETVEKESRLEELSFSGCVILLEDLSNLLANEMYREKRSVSDILEGLLHLGRENDLVIVTNEIFSDGRTYDAFTEEFIQNLAELNQRIASHPLTRSVTEVVASIPIPVK